VYIHIHTRAYMLEKEFTPVKFEMNHNTSTQNDAKITYKESQVAYKEAQKCTKGRTYMQYEHCSASKTRHVRGKST
jgi:hypothetical protein